MRPSMRPSAAVDGLILWHAAGILVLAWLLVAAVSMDGLLTRPSYASLTNPFACEVEHQCGPAMHSSPQ